MRPWQNLSPRKTRCFVRAISQQRQHKALQYDWKTTTSTNKSCLWLEASVFMYYFPCLKCTHMIQVQSLIFALALRPPRQRHFCLVNKRICYSASAILRSPNTPSKFQPQHQIQHHGYPAQVAIIRDHCMCHALSLHHSVRWLIFFFFTRFPAVLLPAVVMAFTFLSLCLTMNRRGNLLAFS